MEVKSFNDYVKNAKGSTQETSDRILLELNRCSTYIDLETFDFGKKETMPGRVLTIAKYAYKSLKAREDHIQFMKGSGWEAMGTTFFEVGVGSRKHKFVVAEFRRISDLTIGIGSMEFFAALELDCDENTEHLEVSEDESYCIGDVQYAQVAEGEVNHEVVGTSDTDYFTE